MSSEPSAAFLANQTSAADKRRVWDLPVRIFHWLLVLAVVGAYVTHRLGIGYFKYHVWLGYLVIVLVGFRVVWGIVGTRHARFANFVRGPVTVIRYGSAVLRGRDAHYVGHNPLGALMVVALLLSLLTQALTGLVANDEIFNTGPLYAYVSPERSLDLTSLHRQLFYWIVVAIVLHIVAVLLHLVVKKENLVRALITGHKSARQVSEAEAISSSRLVAAIFIAALIVALLVWVVQTAPAPSAFFDASY